MHADDLFPLILQDKQNEFLAALDLIDINESNESGQNLLHLAIACRNTPFAEELIRRGIDVNHQNDNGNTPLHTAAAYKNLAVAKRILDAGGDVNIYDRDGNGPLGKAMHSGDAKMVELFMKHGADPHHKNNYGLTPIAIAKDSDNAELLALLNADCSPEIEELRSRSRNTPANIESQAILHEIHSLTKSIDAIAKTVDDGGDRSQLFGPYVKRAKYYEDLGNDDKSIEDYRNALDVANIQQQRSDIARIRSALALAFARSRHEFSRHEDAVYWALGAVDLAPESADARYTLGLVCETCGFGNLAIDSLKKALELQPNHLDAMRALGVSLRGSFELDEAIQTLSVYLARAPHDPRGLYELGRTFQFAMHIRGAKEKAKELYEKALVENPSPELKRLIERKLSRLDRSPKP